MVPITLWPALRVSRASDLPKPDDAPVISQVDGRAAAISVDEVRWFGEEMARDGGLEWIFEEGKLL